MWGIYELPVPHYAWCLTWGGEKQDRLWGGPSELPSKGCCGGLRPTLPTWSEHPRPPPQDTFPTLLPGTVRTPQTGATPVLTVSGTQYLLALPEYSCMDRKDDPVSCGQVYHRIMRERGLPPTKAQLDRGMGVKQLAVTHTPSSQGFMRLMSSGFVVVEGHL